MKKINGIKSNSSGKFKGNYKNKIVIAETEEEKPTNESVFKITFISRINGIAEKISESVYGYDIQFFNL